MTMTNACKRTFYRKISIKQSTPLILFILVTLGEQTPLLDRTNQTCRKNLVLDRLLGEHLHSSQHLNPTYICPGIVLFYCLLTHHWTGDSSENLTMLPEYINSEKVARINELIYNKWQNPCCLLNSIWFKNGPPIPDTEHLWRILSSFL